MIFDKSIQNIEKIFDENIEKIFDENIEKIFDENIVLVKDDSEALNECWENKSSSEFTFISFLPPNWLSLQPPNPASNSIIHLHIILGTKFKFLQTKDGDLKTFVMMVVNNRQIKWPLL